MQSSERRFDVTPSLSSPSRLPVPDAPDTTYTPRTVWQTPHGLAPTLTRPRAARGTALSKVMRRSLRLIYRLRRMSRDPATPGQTASWPRASSFAVHLGLS